MRKLPIVVLICTLILGLSGVLALHSDMGASIVYAELSKEKAETLLGYNQTGNLGNTVAAGTSIKVAERWGYADEFTCYSFVTNSGGVTAAGTASWQLESSYDGSTWAILQGVSITASEEDLITNATAGAAKYYRANVTAMETANTTYVNVQCIFQ